MSKKQKQPHILENLLLNIVLPVIILNKADRFFPEDGALYSLLLALSLPFLYGLKEFIKSKELNIISVIGLLGVGLTGGGALLKLDSHFFAIKEALVPLFVASCIFGSVIFKKPVMKLLLFKSSLFKTDLILQKIQNHQEEAGFEKLMNKTSLAVGLLFIASGFMNFFIALWIFKDIPENISEELQAKILNGQIADMTWLSYLIIALPLTILSGITLWVLVKELKKLTGLTFEEMVNKD